MVATISRRPALAAPHWRLVGPWYRWPRPGLPEDGRVSRPAIQKFAGDDFVQAFLARPQRSLKLDPVVDVVNELHFVSAVPGGPLAQKLNSLFPVNRFGRPLGDGEAAFRSRLSPTNLRKLYQPTHDRHYLITCELHCDEPGFPRVSRQRVCQAGFVIRRRRSIVPSSITDAAFQAQVGPLHKLEAELQELLTKAGARDTTAVAKRRDEIKRKRAEVDDWFRTNGISALIEGWFPTSRLSGSWRPLDEGQQRADVADTGEQLYPLFSLVPDPRETSHDAANRTLYYGTIPTTGLEHDESGTARFDDRSTYEACCFVREHHAAPAHIGKGPDCCGPVVWSLASEAFRLAAPFDALGTANRPITIKMPDLRELAALAAQRPRGRLSPVRFVQPQHMSPELDGNALAGGKMSGEAICGFSIPLITIVAMFVLNLFLPIVVLAFQLWFLLAFRFCIPPQVKLAASVDAALAAVPPNVDLDLDFQVEVDGAKRSAEDLNARLRASLVASIKELTGSDDAPSLERFSNNALAPLNQALYDAANPESSAGGAEAIVPSVGSPLVYEEPVVAVWPRAGATA